MRDTGYIVRKAYYEALNGNLAITVGLTSVNVPVVDVVKSTTDFPYVKLGTQSFTEALATKACFNSEATIELDIVTGFLKGNYGGKTQSDIIADQILQLVHPDITLATDFQCVSTTLENSITLEEMTNTHHIFRRILRFRNFIHQLT